MSGRPPRRRPFGWRVSRDRSIFFCIWCGRPSRALWQALALAGFAGFSTAIGIHPLIGYTDPTHLAPAYVGAIAFASGLILCRDRMIHGPGSFATSAAEGGETGVVISRPSGLQSPLP